MKKLILIAAVALATVPGASGSLGLRDVERAVAIINAKPSLHPRLLYLAKRLPLRCGIGVSADFPDHLLLWIFSGAGPWSEFSVDPEGENPQMRRGGPDYTWALGNYSSLTEALKGTVPCTLSRDGKVALGAAFTARAADNAAKEKVRFILPPIEAYYADHNTYVGMTLAGLKTIDRALNLSYYRLTRVTGTSYCIQSPASGGHTWKKEGPAAAITRGAC